MGELDLTESDILVLLQRAKEQPVLASDPPGARTTQDIADELKLDIKTVREMIRDLKKRAVPLEIVEVIRLNIWDRPYRTKAFRLKQNDE